MNLVRVVPTFLFLFFAACASPSNLTVGGVPGILVNQSNNTEQARAARIPDPTYLPEKRSRGQLRFGMQIEPDVEPGRHSKRKLIRREPREDLVPTAIEASMDRGRARRIGRLVR